MVLRCCCCCCCPFNTNRLLIASHCIANCNNNSALAMWSNQKDTAKPWPKPFTKIHRWYTRIASLHQQLTTEYAVAIWMYWSIVWIVDDEHMKINKQKPIGTFEARFHFGHAMRCITFRIDRLNENSHNEMTHWTTFGQFLTKAAPIDTNCESHGFLTIYKCNADSIYELWILSHFSINMRRCQLHWHAGLSGLWWILVFRGDALGILMSKISF